MNIKVDHYKQVLLIAECLSSSLDSAKVRMMVGKLLLDLLDADYYASYVWDDVARKFDQGVSINMDKEKLKEYEEYHQFHDPITHRMQKRQRATRITDVIDQDELVASKFYNDFLCHDGLYWGMNLYAYDDRENIGDIRIWRSKNKSNFDKLSIQLLQMVEPYFTNFMRNVRFFDNKSLTHSDDAPPIPEMAKMSLDIELVAKSFGFTRREAEIVRELLRGKKDDAIAQELCVAYSTIRTHIKHIYVKASVHNRSALCHKVLNQLTSFI